MKKRVAITLFVALLTILSASFIISAQEILPAPSDQEKVDAAYLWLSQQVDGRWPTLTTDTIALSLLALGHDDRLAADAVAALRARQDGEARCFPSDATSRNCKSLDTALATLALQRLGQPVEDETDWLLGMQTPFRVSGVNWLLQVDTREASNCTVAYDNNEYFLNIMDDKSYSWSGASPSCLVLTSIVGDRFTSGNDWIRISTNCLDKVYSVSCESQAAISLPYHLNTLYVSAETFYSPADVEIRTVCIREGSVCSYEATLWTAYALQQAGRDYTQLLPYLIGEAANNRALLPDAILYLLTSKEEHALSVLSQQNRDGWVQATGGKGRYWDTALAVWSLATYAPDNSTKGKDWLLRNQNSDNSFGTTNKIKDTSLVLYAGWPRGVAVGRNDCEDVFGYFCRSACNADEEQSTATCLTGVCCRPRTAVGTCQSVSDCSRAQCAGQFVTDVFGRRGICESAETVCNDNFDNDNDGRTDLDDSDCSQTCFDLGGEECSVNQDCDGTLRGALGTNRCCLGNCITTSVTCGSKGGYLCGADQVCNGNLLSASDASANNVCCSDPCEEERRVWPYVVILLLLLVGGAGFYAYKKGLLDKYFKKGGKGKKGPEERFPPYSPPVRPYIPEEFESRGDKVVATETEKELEETMKKLKRYTGEQEEAL